MGLRPPTSDLRGFPSQTISVSTDLYRTHERDLDPWWFQHDGLGRFDLRPPNGTCYLALSAVGSFIEKFANMTSIAAEDVAARRLSRLHLPEDIVVADCTHPSAQEFGIMAAIHSTPDFVLTQQWAEAFRNAGFAGIRYFCSQDPSQTEVAIAWFGMAGEADFAVEETVVIPQTMLQDVAERFGKRVMPTLPWRRP